MTIKTEHFDIVIVGGGMVGASLALALSKLPYKVALVEAFEPQSQSQPSFDDRCLALSLGSVKILQGLGLWEKLQPFATSIDNVLVCDRGHFGFHRISASQKKQPFLGQVITSRDCGQVFWKLLRKQTNLKLFCPAKVFQLQQFEDECLVTLKSSEKQPNQQQQISASLIIAADGAQSKTRQLAGIDCQVDDYGQSAIIANIQTQLPHQNLAIERFTENGPLAILPLQDRLSLVWTVPTSKLEQTLALPEKEFIYQLQLMMGQRLGRITRIGERFGYPLKLLKAKEICRQRVVVMGNASHSIHPIAGQGFNLGLRDVAWLTESLIDARALGQESATPAVLNAYKQNREQDINRTIELTDSLARLFANSNSVLTLARNIALAAMPFIPPLNQWLSDTAMGAQAPVPRLSCGEMVEDLLLEKRSSEKNVSEKAEEGSSHA